MTTQRPLEEALKVWAEVVTFRFNKSVSNPDPYLKDKLLAETSGVFQWCKRMEEDHMFKVLKTRVLN